MLQEQALMYKNNTTATSMELGSTPVDDDCSTVKVSNARRITLSPRKKEKMGDEDAAQKIGTDEAVSRLKQIFRPILQTEGGGSKFNQLLLHNLEGIPLLVELNEPTYPIVRRFSCYERFKPNFVNALQNGADNLLRQVVKDDVEAYEGFLADMNRLNIELAQQPEEHAIAEIRVIRKSSSRDDSSSRSSLTLAAMSPPRTGTQTIQLDEAYNESSPSESVPAETELDGQTDPTAALSDATSSALEESASTDTSAEMRLIDAIRRTRAT